MTFVPKIDTILLSDKEIRKGEYDMIALMIITMFWLVVGVYSITLENVENDSCINYPFAIFMATVPFFPWIAHICGVV